jgi:hypothetical protein
MGIICSTSSKTKPEPSKTSNPPKKDLEEPSQPPKKDLEEPSKPSLKSEIPADKTSFTFKVDPVELSKGPHDLATAEDILRKVILFTEDFDATQHTERKFHEFKGKLEDFSHLKDKDPKYLSAKVHHGLVGVIHNAFESRYALSLSASDFIIMIGQGLGYHMNRLYGEKGFVEYEGEQSIEVTRGEQNDWSAVFDQLAEQIQGKIKADVYGVIRDNTSAATTVSRIASEIALNRSMQTYFIGEVKTSEIPGISCGIPEITLEGAPEDWQKLKDKVKKLIEMNKDDCLRLKYWLDQLVPVVDKICEAGIERKVDKEFWSNIYKYHRKSDGDRITGWITRFFPGMTNFPLDKKYHCEGIRGSFIEKQVREVPFTWNNHESKIPMFFTAGFLGAEFNKDLCQVKAVRFWCVTKAEERE